MKKLIGQNRSTAELRAAKAAESKPSDNVRPCASCGRPVEVTRQDQIVQLQSHHREVPMPGGGGVVVDQSWVFTVARCDRCGARREIAERIVKEHAAALAPIGGPSHTVELVYAMLSGLAAVGTPMQTVLTIIESSPRTLRRAVRSLAGPGDRALWERSLTPIARRNANPSRPNESPWGHVPETLLQELRDAWGLLLLEDVGLTRRVPPPEGGERGCLICGIATVEVKHGEGQEVWGDLRKAQPGNLGGKPVPTPLRGYLCPECRSEVDDVGTLGRTALERALVKFIGAHPPIAVQEYWLPNLRAWAALPDAKRIPRPTRFAHEPLDSWRATIEGADPTEMAAATV